MEKARNSRVKPWNWDYLHLVFLEASFEARYSTLRKLLRELNELPYHTLTTLRRMGDIRIDIRNAEEALHRVQIWQRNPRARFTQTNSEGPYDRLHRQG